MSYYIILAAINYASCHVLNKAGKAVLHNALQKITNAIFIELTYNKNNKMQINESLPYRLLTISVKCFIGDVKIHLWPYVIQALL
jgi:hypothetical protein